MKKFEYKIETNLGENNLNIYGLEGWELVSVSKIKTPQSEDTKFYFKKETTTCGKYSGTASCTFCGLTI